MRRWADETRFRPTARSGRFHCSAEVDASAADYTVSAGPFPWQSLDRAVADVCGNGGVVWIPPRTRVFVENPPLRVPAGVAIIGAGFSSEVMALPAAPNSPKYPIIEITARPSPGPVESDRVLLQGFRMHGLVDPQNATSGYRGQTAVQVGDCQCRVEIRDLWIDKFSWGELTAQGSPFRGAGIRAVGDFHDLVVDGTTITGCGTGVRVEARAPVLSGTRTVTVRSSMIVASTALGLYAGARASVFVTGCLFEHSAGPAVLSADAAVISLRNCHVEHNWARYSVPCCPRGAVNCTEPAGCPNGLGFVCVEVPTGFRSPDDLANFRGGPGGEDWPRAAVFLHATRAPGAHPAHVFVTGNHLLNTCADGDLLVSGAMAGLVRGNEAAKGLSFSMAMEGLAREWVTNLGNHAFGCSRCDTLHTARCG